MDARTLGSFGEEQAARYLRRKGYRIVERNFRCRQGEIDLIARKGKYLVFVEVKTRRNNDFRRPEQAVDYNKQHNLLRAINHYIHYCHLNMPWRFDVITVVGMPGCHHEIEHIEDFQLHRR